MVQRRTRDTGETGYIQENQGYTGEPGIYRRTRDTGEPGIQEKQGYTGEQGIQVNQGIYRRTRNIQENQGYR